MKRDNTYLKRFLILMLVTGLQFAVSQSVFTARVLDEKNQTPLEGANVYIETLDAGGMTDGEGRVLITNIPDGTYWVTVSFIGYQTQRRQVGFPRTDPSAVLLIALVPEALKTEGITVTTTRTNGVIANTPVRIEVLGLEEVREETAIKPGNISKLMGETSGIQVQQTSATSGNVSFRIQGLPGKYTQLLKDGFPLYSGFSSGLSLLQIPPLDLRQVEVVKGSSSVLYGGDAIAGIVNLVSKEPTMTPEWLAIVNQTHKEGRDISSFYTAREKKFGITFLASQSSQRAYDVDGDGFTDIPEFQQTTLSPKILYYPDAGTTVMFGITTSFENREGGDLYAIRNAPNADHSYVEKNQSSRLTSQLKFERKFQNGNRFTLKNSVYDFKREISLPEARFGGVQLSSYSDLSYFSRAQHHDIVLGLNLLTDRFDENQKLSLTEHPLDYNYTTAGLYAQDDWNLSTNMILQSGVRVDHNNIYGTFVMPHLSGLIRLPHHFTARVGYGTGYKLPTAFTSEAESRAFEEVRPVSANLKSEISRGVDLDLNYKFLLDELIIAVDQAFYTTVIDHALIPDADSLMAGILAFENAPAALKSKGLDTNLKISLDELVLFVDYTYTDVRKNYNAINPQLELTPNHKLNMTLSYEAEGSWSTGLEAFYTGKMYLEGMDRSRDYWTIGLMGRKIFSNFSIIANVENLFDVRQSDYDAVVTGPQTDPSFAPLFAPLDGIVANVALELMMR